jgi:hypothetical protein
MGEWAGRGRVGAHGDSARAARGVSVVTVLSCGDHRRRRFDADGTCPESPRGRHLRLFHEARVVYFPSLIEWMLRLGVVAAAGLVFSSCQKPAGLQRTAPGVDYLAGLPRLSYGTLRPLWNTTVTNSFHRVTLIG